MSEIQYAAIPGNVAVLSTLPGRSFGSFWRNYFSARQAEYTATATGEFSVEDTQLHLGKILANFVQGNIFKSPWGETRPGVIRQHQITFVEGESGLNELYMGVYRRVTDERDRMIEFSRISDKLSLPQRGCTSYANRCRLSDIAASIERDFVDTKGRIRRIYDTASVDAVSTYETYGLFCRCFRPETLCSEVEETHDALYSTYFNGKYDTVVTEDVAFGRNRFVNDWDTFYSNTYKRATGVAFRFAPLCCYGDGENPDSLRRAVPKGVQTERDVLFTLVQEELEDESMVAGLEKAQKDYEDAPTPEQQERVLADWAVARQDFFSPGDRIRFCQGDGQDTCPSH